MLDFRPPLDSPAMIGFAKLLFPLYMKIGMDDTQVIPAPGAVERFKKVQGHRADGLP